MSLSQCFMSSIVAVSFLCKGRTNGAVLSLALFKLALAHGLSAAWPWWRGRDVFRGMEGVLLLCP